MVVQAVPGLAPPAAANPPPGCVPGAHRAATAAFGEETVQSIDRIGSPVWLDVDAALTASPDYMVGMHDANTGRISLGKERLVPENSTIAALRAVKLIWPNVRIPTVREMLFAAKASGANVLLEMKRWGTYSGRWQATGFQHLHDWIVEAGMLGRAYVGGVGPDRTAFHAAFPDVRLFIRTFVDDPAPMTEQWVTDRVGTNGFVGLQKRDWQPSLITALHVAGVHVGTKQLDASDLTTRQTAWDRGIKVIQSSWSTTQNGCTGLTP